MKTFQLVLLSVVFFDSQLVRIFFCKLKNQIFQLKRFKTLDTLISDVYCHDVRLVAEELRNRSRFQKFAPELMEKTWVDPMRVAIREQVDLSGFLPLRIVSPTVV
jgi:hypothetical protein